MKVSEQLCVSLHRRNISIIFKFGELLGGLEYWHQRADERHGNLPQGNQELLVVRDEDGRPQVSSG